MIFYSAPNRNTVESILTQKSPYKKATLLDCSNKAANSTSDKMNVELLSSQSNSSSILRTIRLLQSSRISAK